MAQSLSKSGDPWKDPGSWPELTEIVDRLRQLGSASGAAVALITNHPGEVDCCARSGVTAPAIGRTPVEEDSLTALCLRSGKQVRCDDAGADLRVRSSILFHLGVRSLVITPIHQQSRVRGVLAVFANQAHGFSTEDLTELRAAANQVAVILEQEQKPPDKPSGRLLALSTPAMGTVEADEQVKPEQGQGAQDAKSAEEQAPAIPAPIPAVNRFATLDAVVHPKREWMTGNVVLMAVVAFLIIVGVAIWAKVASNSTARNLTVKIEPSTDSGSTADTGHRSSKTSATQAALRIEPAPASSPGPTVAFNVVFSHGKDISAVPMEIDYDAQVLRLVSLAEGDFFTKGGQKAVVSHRDDSSSGILKINLQLPPGASGISGDGTVCRLVFAGVEVGSGSISVTATAHNSHDQTIDVLGSRVAIRVN